MPPMIRLTRAGDKYLVARVDGTGNVVSDKRFSESDSAIRTAAKIIGVSWVDLARWAGELRRSGKDAIMIPLGPTEETASVFTLRGIASEKREVFSDIHAALSAPFDGESVVEWSSTSGHCILDVDFHNGEAPPIDHLDTFAAYIKPSPSAWWISKHGGLHLLYVKTPKLNADEFAAVAGIRCLRRFPVGIVELKHTTRKPGKYIKGTQSESIHLGDIVGVSVDFPAYLDDRGMEVGGRYPHTQCPVMPSDRAVSNSPPVVVSENHIHCYVCESDGIRRGSRYAGFFPASVLCGKTGGGMFEKCVANFTHWQHAGYVVRQVVPQENLAKTVYSAALKLKHSDDPRIPLVWSAGPRTGILRYDGFWAGYSGRAKAYSKDSAVLCELPACKFVAGDELKVNKLTAEEFASTDDLTPYGYPALVCLWGIRLTEMQDSPDSRIFTVMRRNGYPNYVPRSRRMPIEDAWRVVEGSFPGVNRSAAQLLIGAKGCAEMRCGLPPILFLSGPTGSGKTQTVNLAASICGDTVTTATYSADEERLRQQIQSAKERGTFVMFDEFLKKASMRHVAKDQAMEFILSLTPDSVSHKLYVGPVALGELPVCVFADTLLPREIAMHAQIARRVHHIHMPGSQNWLADAKEFRNSEENCKAADAILSDIMDRWFVWPGPTNFADIARVCGFGTLDSSDEASYKETAIRNLFDAVCAAPDDPRNPGWKWIDPTATGGLADAWLAVADKDVTSSRMLSELDLGKLLGIEGVQCKVRPIRGKVLIRFTDNRGTSNEDLRDGGRKLDP